MTKIYFAENLKRLRKEKGLTQESLADILGVSFQAISKWERGENYPDIALLPAIAAYFGVSIDMLLGADKMQSQAKIQEYLDMYDNMHLKDISSVFEEFKKAVRAFPGNFSVMIRYMELLMEEKDHTRDPDYNKTSKELMSIYENIQKHCTDDSIRIWSKRLMCEHLMRKYQCLCNEEGKYCSYKEYYNQAKSIINELPAITDSKEIISMALGFDRETHLSTHLDAIKEMLYMLQNTIIGYCYYDDGFLLEYKIEIIHHMNALFSMFYEQDNFENCWMHIIYNYGHLGHFYFELGDIEKALKYLRIAAEYAVKCDSDSDTAEKAARFYEREEIFRDMNMCTRLALLMKQHYPLSSEFREMPEFKEIIDLLGNPDTEKIVL
ncbi:MAG: helix-turn-helix transcriptional regulator [Clostridia bacterium]|nr:helix-turn-helix transcriptional regulator [Clostridia bacterium]